MIRLDDHDKCRCGHIRADHLQCEEVKAIEAWGECRSYYKMDDGLMHPCECDRFERASQAPSEERKP